jgi:hypothetical protein
MRGVQQHLSRYLLGYAVAAMALGLALYHPQAGWTKTHSRLLGDLTTVGVFLIIFPMMINVPRAAFRRCAHRGLEGAAMGDRQLRLCDRATHGNGSPNGTSDRYLGGWCNTRRARRRRRSGLGYQLRQLDPPPRSAVSAGLLTKISRQWRARRQIGATTRSVPRSIRF